MSEQRHPEAPVLRVVRGDATAEEIAALLAVLATASTASAAEESATDPRGHSLWNDRAAALRAGVRPGPGAWRSSAWPG